MAKKPWKELLERDAKRDIWQEALYFSPKPGAVQPRRGEEEQTMATTHEDVKTLLSELKTARIGTPAGKTCSCWRRPGIR